MDESYKRIIAQALHRIYNIPIKPQGNDFEYAKHFEEALDIEIQIFDLESRQIYRGVNKPIKVYILMSENHYDVISNLAGFTCENASHHKTENQQCKACKSKTKCNTSVEQVTCEKCSKYFYGKICLDNHVKNKKCIEHSYRCKLCQRFYKTRDLETRRS
jgi:hypothetical protein